jgi:polysaccharide chain length determinant protein (PEP-CTERM system associated)
MNSLHIRIHQILAGAWRRRHSIVLPIIILPIVAIAFSLMSTKNYSSHTSMLIQETAKLNPFLEDLAVSAMLKERIGALKTLLHSRHILTAVALDRGLVDQQTSPEQHDQVIQELSNALTIAMLGKDFIRIDYASDTPFGMKEMLASISEQFVEQVLAPERSSMTSSSQFLLEHLEKRQQELDRAEKAMAEFIDSHANDLPELHLTNINRLSKLKQRLSEREAEMAGASRSLGNINQQLSKTNPVLAIIEQKMIASQADLVSLRGRYTERHSAVISAIRNLKRLQQEHQVELNKSTRNDQENPNNIDSIDKLWAIGSQYKLSEDVNKTPLLISQLENMQATGSKVVGLKEEVNSLKKIINELENSMLGYGKNASQLSKLERELVIKRDLYDDILLRYEKANISASLGVFEHDKRVKIIDRPFTPLSPSNHPLILFIISGLIAGLLLGCGLAIILELSDNSLRSNEKLEAITGVPVLSRIPLLYTHSRND